MSELGDKPEMSAAYRKFKELDVDSVEALGPTELLVLAEFIFTSFSPTGKMLQPGVRVAEGSVACTLTVCGIVCRS